MIEQRSLRHLNNGDCPKCRQIFDTYPGFYEPLKKWFFNFQEKFETAHISCAGRGKAEQEKFKRIGSSNSDWMESAHNWNAAIDIFWIVDGQAVYYRDWYKQRLWPELEGHLDFKWFGAPDTKFYELPHVQVRDWVAMAKTGELRLVE